MEKLKKTKILISIILFGMIVVFAQLFCAAEVFADDFETSSGTPFVIEKNEIESIKLYTYDSTQLKIGDSATLNVKATPQNANLTLQEIRYNIIRGKDFAQIKANKLTISQNALIGATVEVQAIVDSVVSENTLTFHVVETPLDKIVIQNNFESLLQGERTKLITKCIPDDATNKSLVFEIIEGGEYCKVLLDGTICVDSLLPRGDLRATVRVSSLSDGSIYTEKSFGLYKPVTSISSFNRTLKNVEQCREYNFGATSEPRTATNASLGVAYSLDVPSSVATISKEGMLKISATAPIGTKITIRMDAADGVSYEQEVEVVPVYATSFAVTSVSAPTHGEKYLPGDIITIYAEFLKPFNITEENKQYRIKVSDQSLATVCGHSIVISENITQDDPHFVVTAYTNQNGIILSQDVEIYVYIPVQKVEATQNVTMLKEGSSYDINELISTQILPQNSEIKQVQFELAPTDYAVVFGDRLIVKNDLPSGDLKIELFAYADGVSSDTFVFNLYKPVQDIQLENADLKEVEQQREYSFSASAYPFNATFGDRPVEYSINVSQDVATIDEDGTLKISATAPIGTKIKIRIDATDGVFHEQEVEVIPVYATSFAVTSVSAPTHGTKYLPGDEIEFVAEFLAPFNITECNKVYEVFVSDPSLAEVDGHIVKIKSIGEITQDDPHFVVTVSSNQNGTMLLESFEISIFIPITKINISQKVETIFENAVYEIGDLVDVEILPQNSEIRDVEYVLSNQNNVVKSGTKLLVKDDLPSGDLTFSLNAKSGEIESESVTFKLYKPVREIVLKNNDLREVEQQREYCFEGVSAPSSATLANVSIIYSINVSQDVATIDEDGTLKISATAPIGTKITIRLDAPDGVFHEQEVEVVPVYATSFAVTSVSAPTHGTKYLPGDEIEFVAEFLAPFNITECNKVYEVFVSDPSLAEVDGHIVKIKSIDEITQDDPHFVVTVFSNQNGEILSETRDIYIFIPVTSVEIAQTKTTLEESKKYSLNSLLSVEIYPLNSEIRNYEYELLSSEFASIYDGELQVQGNLPSGALKVQLRVKCDGIYSNTLTYEIYKPTRFVNISADNSNPISSMLSGEQVNLTVSVSETASVLNPSLTIIKGAELIEGDYKNGDKIGLCFFVKKNLCEVENLDKQITIQASQDGIKQSVDIFVYIPNEQISINIEKLSRGNNTYSTTHTNNADDTRWVIVSKPDCVTTMELGQIYIDPKTTAGTKVKIVYKSKDRLSKEFESEFVVDGLDQTQAEIVFASSGSICDASKFNVIVGQDSESVAITQDCHQLHVGRSTDVQVKYRGLALEEYGLQLGDCKITKGKATIAYIDPDYIQIALSDEEVGGARISFSAQIIDGDKSYEINLENIFTAFRPMSGTPKFGPITSMDDYIPISFEDFDQTASYTTSYLKFEGETSNNSSITENGKLTLVAGKSSLTQYFVITCQQNYNGTTIEYKRYVNAKLKEMELNHNGGTSNTSEIVAIPGFQSKVEVPQYIGWKFDGYYNTFSTAFELELPSGSPMIPPQQIVDEEGNVDFTENVKALTAHWTPIQFRLKINCNVGLGYYISEPLYGHREYDFQTDTFNFTYFENGFGSTDKIKNGSGLDFDSYHKDGVYLGKNFKISNWATKDGEVVEIMGTKSNSTCVATGTMITLADGTQKAVEDLNGTEQLLVWNLFTGTFDSAPILFIDSHGENIYKILRLQFEDGACVDVIDEHGFWDYNQNKYVYITNSNAEYFVGHDFDQHFVDENGVQRHKKVKLISFEIFETFTNAWSPVTFEHLCYYVDGMLSVPAATEGFTNIFEVNANTMQIDAEKMQQDIETYGTFDYEKDFKDLIPQEIFEAFGGEYLKVSIGKGYITFGDIEGLIEKYKKFFVMEEMDE